MSSNCYLCGSSAEHSYDCPKYEKILVAISTASTAVIKDITTDNKITFSTHYGIWRMDQVRPYKIVPEWAERGWYHEYTENLYALAVDIPNRLRDFKCDAASILDIPGWPISSRGAQPGEPYCRTESDLLVFALIGWNKYPHPLAWHVEWRMLAPDSKIPDDAKYGWYWGPTRPPTSKILEHLEANRTAKGKLPGWPISLLNREYARQDYVLVTK